MKALHRLKLYAVLGLITVVSVACAVSPTGRHQFLALSSSELNKMGVSAYQEIKSQTPLSKNSQQNQYIQCIANHIIEASGSNESWETNLFDDQSVNAFALPGGKIGIYTGLLTVAKNQHQVAAVMGHEVGHVLAQHSNERMSIEYASSTGLQLLSVLAGADSTEKGMLIGLLGVGAQFGISLPFSRKHESEADLIGLELMAKAGFDPRESVKLWQNMAAAGGSGGPEFLSTHPSHSTRIKDLERSLPKVMPLYEQAKAQGRRPNC